MRISTELRGDEVLMKLAGDIDPAGADELAVALDKAENSPAERVVLDLSGVGMITSAGLGTIIITYKRLLAGNRCLELKNLQPGVRQVFLMTGLDKLMTVHESASRLPSQESKAGEKALRNARKFLGELFDNFGIEAGQAGGIIEEVFRICQAPKTSETDTKESQLRALLEDIDLPARIAESLKDRPTEIHARILPYTVGTTSLLHVRCGDGRVAEAFAQDGNIEQIQLIDVLDRSRSPLPFMKYDGIKIPLPDKSFDLALLDCALNCSRDPAAAIREVIRVARKRIVVIESICLNETQRQFNMFFDWFFNVVLDESSLPARNFKKPDEWKWFFRDAGLSIRASVDMGMACDAVPEYYWMYVLYLPNR